jgi:hypothetical protein
MDRGHFDALVPQGSPSVSHEVSEPGHLFVIEYAAVLGLEA